MLIRGDARALPLRDATVNCVVTSPPYWGLRDYNTPGQIGLEPTPEQYVAELVGVFREVWRVLKPEGTVWLNLGDSYAAGKQGQDSFGDASSGLNNGRGGLGNKTGEKMRTVQRKPPDGLKPKDLVGIPWRVAFALQADGWYLRSDIIWHKPNPMPESVTDRPTKSHEYLFLLAKQDRYYYDADAIREAHTHPDADLNTGDWATDVRDAGRIMDRPFACSMSRPKTHIGHIKGRNKRTVWTVATEPYSGAHFATMPEALVEPCILAGCPLGGLVLDPFVGSGTVVAVATRLGRRAVGIDLAYQDLSRARTAQRGLQFGGLDT